MWRSSTCKNSLEVLSIFKNQLVQAANNALRWVVSIGVGALAESYNQGRDDVQPLAFLQLISQWGT